MSEEIPDEQNQILQDQASGPSPDELHANGQQLPDVEVQNTDTAADVNAAEEAKKRELHARESMNPDSVIKDPDLMKAILHDPEGLERRLKLDFVGNEREAGKLVDDTFNVLRRDVMGAQYGHDEASRIFEGVTEDARELVEQVQPQLNTISTELEGTPNMIDNFSRGAVHNAKAALQQIGNFLNDNRQDPEEIKSAVRQLQTFSDQYHRFYAELNQSTQTVVDSTRGARNIVEDKLYKTGVAKSEIDTTFQDMSHIPATQVSDEMIYKVAHSGLPSLGAFRSHRESIITQKEEATKKVSTLVGGLEGQLDTFMRITYQDAGVVEDKLPLPNRVTDAAQEFDRVLYSMAQHGGMYRSQLDQFRFEFTATVSTIEGELEYMHRRAVNKRQPIDEIKRIMTELQATIQQGSQETF